MDFSGGAARSAGPVMSSPPLEKIHMNMDSGSDINCGVLHGSGYSFGEFNLHLQFTPKKRRDVFEVLKPEFRK